MIHTPSYPINKYVSELSDSILRSAVSEIIKNECGEHHSEDVLSEIIHNCFESCGFIPRTTSVERAVLIEAAIRFCNS